MTENMMPYKYIRKVTEQEKTYFLENKDYIFYHMRKFLEDLVDKVNENDEFQDIYTFLAVNLINLHVELVEEFYDFFEKRGLNGH